MPARREPAPHLSAHPPYDVQPVAPSVERYPGFVQACFGWKSSDGFGRYVRNVRDQQVDSSLQPTGEGLEEVAFMDVAQRRGEVASGAGDCRWFDIGRVYLQPCDSAVERCCYGAAAATQIDDDGVWPSQFGGLADQEFGTPTRYENPWVYFDSQPVELHPAEHVFKWLSGDPARDQACELGWN